MSVGELYAALGGSLTPDTEQAMRDYLGHRPKDQHGVHEYSFADLRLDPTIERERFARVPGHVLGPRGASSMTRPRPLAGVHPVARRRGRAITEADFPPADFDRAEGFRHLALQTACWLWWSVGHDDPGNPMFQRQNDLLLQWGGPNGDNVYRHARVIPR